VYQRAHSAPAGHGATHAEQQAEYERALAEYHATYPHAAEYARQQGAAAAPPAWPSPATPGPLVRNATAPVVHTAAAPAGVAAGHPMGTYFYSCPKEFKLKERLGSLSGDSSVITDVANGAVVMKMNGAVPGAAAEKSTLSDAAGTRLYVLSDAVVSLRDRMFVSDATTRAPVLTLRKKGFLPMMGTSTVLCFRGGSDDGNPYLMVKGNIARKAFTVTDVATARVVASVRRRADVRSVMTDRENDSYLLRVEAGMDAALMCTLAVALDEHYRDDGNRSGLTSFL
jgi:uncharacterized protein YxjI